MKFDTPATANPTDRMKVLGKPLDRVDGKLKTTGTAHYAYERNDAAPNAAYGYILGAAIAKGRIESIDTADAKAAPGVLAVVTYENAGKLGKAKNHTARMLAGPEVQHYDQAVAVVVAETFEQARAATKLLRVNYARAKGNFDLAASKASATKPKSGTPDTAVGDFAGAFAKAAVKLDERYTTPDQSHMMMEPHSTTAAWKDGKLTLWTSNQMIAWAVGDMSETLLLPKESIHVMSPYVGGGFGSKLWVRSDAVMAALGSRAIGGRPVKLALARPQVMNNTTHRPATIQRLRIGAQKDGKITAIAHESWSGDLPGGGPETAPNATRLLYAGANRMTATRLAVLDLPEGNAMRAPGEAVGLLALEAAMDELAEKLKMDPVQLRIINDTQVDPEKPSRQFSQRDLVGCLKTGAERFGWNKRNPVPGQVRDGRWLVGMGMASAFRDNVTMKSGARVGIDKKGVVTVATDMTDIGTGSYTIIGQTVAEMMGVPMDKVIVLLGDSSFPASSGSGGQWGGNSSTAGVYAACMALRERVSQKLGFNSTDVVFEDGKVKSGNRSVSLSEAAGDAGLSAEDSIEFGDLTKTYAQATFGAHFVEVGVDSATGEIRVRRMSGAFAAGRILNPKSARSQVIGAMTMGVGAALMEDAIVDTRFGYFVNHDLAEYHVPAHADIPMQDVFFMDELDEKSSPMKAKGIGELGLCGVGAAIANAVYNACGVRIREYPLTLDKVIGKMA
ncbi:xanthine dehydrogenase YagR molybdenum-binding subunit [Sphingomonas sp. PP-CE-3A-406]|uniref:aldehyde oxidoreductase molybdenum-binding subunit PaoC n=1 Tax=Sphingomonas sp. PP-CE-3A-406 TaxID=2135659 RepID=UPI000EF8E352|nr:aldehyde oxidoreductase molybdenum-binding subunit PaoC [Sphingomonas sp. PP-CE-3A-406]RMB55070.1 xanthine dehydrogenase YagR molybdenum-binding subunit [Sphingomonas sp. PP-CE-3A-406]